MFRTPRQASAMIVTTIVCTSSGNARKSAVAYLAYLLPSCQPVSGISGRRHLRLADRGHLDFPRVKLASYRGRSFAYAGPSNWNSLPAYLRDSSLVFLFHLLSTTSKPFSFLTTRLAHAARLEFFYKKRAI